MLLHEDDVPISSKGLGTRRLTGIAIQASGVEGESVIAIDEIELGLEPHRLAHLLRYLGNEVSESAKQVFTTTHSPVVVTNLKARDLAVVSNSGGETEVRNIVDQSGDSQAAIRSCPEGLLARRILIGEGATEVGLVRGLCRMWDDERQTDVELSTSVTAGFQIVDGRGGAGAIQKAKVFHQLGYTTGILIDNDDRGVDQEAQNVADLGVELIRWESGRALEEEIVQALSEEGVVSLVEVAIAEHGEQSVRHEVERNLEGVDLSGAAPADWSSAIGNLDTIKKAVAFAAKGDRDRKKPGWFKRQDGGELLAGLLEKYRPTLADTSLAVHLTHLRRFVYGDHSSEKE